MPEAFLDFGTRAWFPCPSGHDRESDEFIIPVRGGVRDMAI
jgi:hypothetical protein